eukprot:gene20431-61307_t
MQERELQRIRGECDAELHGDSDDEVEQQAKEWHEKEVCWLHGRDAIEYARWYLVGIEHGGQPLASGLCSFCGSYVFGALGSISLGG